MPDALSGNGRRKAGDNFNDSYHLPPAVLRLLCHSATTLTHSLDCCIAALLLSAVAVAVLQHCIAAAHERAAVHPLPLTASCASRRILADQFTFAPSTRGHTSSSFSSGTLRWSERVELTRARLDSTRLASSSSRPSRPSCATTRREACLRRLRRSTLSDVALVLHSRFSLLSTRTAPLRAQTRRPRRAR